MDRDTAHLEELPADAGSSTTAGSPDGIGFDELALATRNHGMPLEALRHDLTPVGLHYVLVHYDIPAVDATTHALTVDGAVADELVVTMDDLAARPQRREVVTMECAGNGRARMSPRAISQPWLHEAVGTAAWTGVPVAALLDEVGVDDDAVEVVFTGMDHGVEAGIPQAYQRSLTLEQARRDGVVLALEMNDAPLPAQHGAPLRLVVPGWYGMASVKWLERMTVVTEPFHGHQMDTAYVVRDHPDEEGRRSTWIQPRSLMQPPGVPEFLSRRRFLAAGPTTLGGRAWSGFAPITRVEVTVDGGATWAEATLDPPAHRHGWRAWTHSWHATDGRHRLASRAFDESGRSQPLEVGFNTGGYEVNAVQWVDVEVPDPT